MANVACWSMVPVSCHDFLDVELLEWWSVDAMSRGDIWIFHVATIAAKTHVLAISATVSFVGPIQDSSDAYQPVAFCTGLTWVAALFSAVAAWQWFETRRWRWLVNNVVAVNTVSDIEWMVAVVFRCGMVGGTASKTSVILALPST